MVMVLQLLWMYQKNPQWTVHFQRVTVICELHPYKAVIKKNKQGKETVANDHSFLENLIVDIKNSIDKLNNILNTAK